MEIFDGRQSVRSKEDELFDRSTIVWKLGTRSICSEDGIVHEEMLASFAEQVIKLRQQGIDSVFVSSGAVAFGELMAPHVTDKKRKSDIGQPLLMLAWIKAFKDTPVMQLLYSEEQLEDHGVLRKEIQGALADGIVPIINCTDPDVNNDYLGAQVASALGADLAILTNTQGILRNGQSIPVVSARHEIADTLTGDVSNGGNGGMSQKFDIAFGFATSTARTAVIARAHDERILERIATRGAFRGTRVQI